MSLFIMRLCGSMSWNDVLYAVQNAQHTTHTPFHDLLSHNRIFVNNDLILLNVLK